MNQPNTTPNLEEPVMSHQKSNKLLLTIIIPILTTALVVGLVMYFVMAKSANDKQSNLEKQIEYLQQKIEVLESQANLPSDNVIYQPQDQEIDSDNDGLSDSRELQLGTNPDNPDTDGDGYLDGGEVVNGYNPLVDEKKEQFLSPSNIRLETKIVGKGNPAVWVYWKNPTSKDFNGINIYRSTQKGTLGELSSLTLEQVRLEGMEDLTVKEKTTYYYTLRSVDKDGQETTNTDQYSITTLGVTVDPTVNWQTYRNEKYGYEIKYPEKYFLNDRSTTESIMFDTEGPGTGLTIEIIEKSYPNRVEELANGGWQSTGTKEVNKTIWNILYSQGTDLVPGTWYKSIRQYGNENKVIEITLNRSTEDLFN